MLLKSNKSSTTTPATPLKSPSMSGGSIKVTYGSAPTTKPLRSSTITGVSSSSAVSNRTSVDISSSEPSQPSGFVIGDSVHVVGTDKFGEVRFVGEVHFSNGLWVGLEMSGPNGKNDGSVQGVKYFECRPLYGLFVRASICTKKKSAAVQTPLSTTPSMATVAALLRAPTPSNPPLPPTEISTIAPALEPEVEEEASVTATATADDLAVEAAFGAANAPPPVPRRYPSRGRDSMGDPSADVDDFGLPLRTVVRVAERPSIRASLVKPRAIESKSPAPKSFFDSSRRPMTPKLSRTNSSETMLDRIDSALTLSTSARQRKSVGTSRSSTPTLKERSESPVSTSGTSNQGTDVDAADEDVDLIPEPRSKASAPSSVSGAAASRAHPTDASEGPSTEALIRNILNTPSFVNAIEALCAATAQAAISTAPVASEDSNDAAMKELKASFLRAETDRLRAMAAVESRLLALETSMSAIANSVSAMQGSVEALSSDSSRVSESVKETFQMVRQRAEPDTAVLEGQLSELLTQVQSKDEEVTKLQLSMQAILNLVHRAKEASDTQRVEHALEVESLRARLNE